jgi:hypothetical protein
MENETKKTWTCSHCSKEFSEEIESHSTFEGDVCPDCLENSYSFCEVSEQYYFTDEVIVGYKMNNNGRKIEIWVHQDEQSFTWTIDDEFWLESDTIEAHVNSVRSTSTISRYDYENGEYFTCDDCGEIFHNDYYNSINDGDRSVCERCYESDYAYCEDCGTSHTCDSDCFNDDSSDLINSYSFRPAPKFRGKNGKFSPFIGFELEIESKNGNKKDQAEDISDNLGEIIYLKTDSSLSNGFEIVSHPMTLQEHKKIDYRLAFDSLAKNGARSHDTATCGLHFHLDKSKMSDTHKVRFGTFFALQKSKLEILARRYSSSYAKFKAKNLKDRKDYLKNSDRYEAVNWQNDNTVEIRIFKGTLKFETFMASMELCQAIFNFTQLRQAFCTLNENQLWGRFLKYVQKNESEYSFLIRYLETKKDLLNKALKLDDLESQKAKIEREINKVNSSMTLNDLQTA